MQYEAFSIFRIMKAYLTSSIGGSIKEDGKRIPDKLFWYNGFLDRLKKDWVPDSRMLFIAASPEDYEKNDEVCECFRHSFPMSGLSIASLEICDNRNPDIVDRIGEMDVLLLSGGHVPTENGFFTGIGLREKLADFEGILIAWSAGSMNCAENVYAPPELDGEALDPDYKRWFLGLTDINIFPHYQYLKDEWLDGYRIMEDITYQDSIGHEIIAMNDGTYIYVEDGTQTLYGEAYRIKDGKVDRICQDGSSVSLDTIR